MPTLKKAIKAVRDALKEATVRTDAERRKVLIMEYGFKAGDYIRLDGKVEGLKLAQRIIDGVFPQ